MNSDEIVGRIPSRAMLYLLWTTAAILGAGLLWSILGKVDVVVTGDAVLAPLGETQRIQAPLEGEVREVRVGEGQTVRSGDLLLKIDSGRSRSERGSLRAAEARVARAREEISTWLPRQEEHWRREAAAMRRIVEELRGLAEGNRRSSRVQESLADQALGLASGRLEQARRQADRSQVLVEARLVSEVDWEKAGLERREAETNFEQLRKKKELTALESVNEIRELESRIARQEAQLAALERERERERNRGERELAEAESAVDQVRFSQHPEARDGVLEIRAPRAGVVTRVVVKREGAVVAAGELLLEIGPEDAPLVARMVVQNKDIARIREGMEVKLQYQAFRHQEFGLLRGRVRRVPADAVHDPAQGPVFLVLVDLVDRSVRVDGREQPLTYGLAARAQIVTARRRLISLFLEPLRDLTDQGRNVNP